MTEPLGPFLARVLRGPRPERGSGQGLAEYALILGLIAIVAIAAMVFLGSVIADLMSIIGSRVDADTL